MYSFGVFLQAVPWRAGGGKFQGQKYYKLNQRKNLLIECAQGDQPVRCPNRVFCVHQFRLVVAFWLVVFPRCVGSGDVRFEMLGTCRGLEKCPGLPLVADEYVQPSYY